MRILKRQKKHFMLNDDCLFDCLKQRENDISPALRALELPFKEKVKISYFGFKRRGEIVGITLISFLNREWVLFKKECPTNVTMAKLGESTMLPSMLLASL